MSCGACPRGTRAYRTQQVVSCEQLLALGEDVALPASDGQLPWLQGRTPLDLLSAELKEHLQDPTCPEVGTRGCRAVLWPAACMMGDGRSCRASPAGGDGSPLAERAGSQAAPLLAACVCLLCACA